ncbi:hypothetical protein [Corynebacterium freneyi]|uniref:Uncharacterized protein n=1 Tax=Corynebacterium freneyi DNF00450 TaxID=1287475 RepID=A0A095ZER1_9CORY|nr:hypothetical protein [Corynebacterium freneyi]KGF17112.1 hypothetical protein HMPREF1650_05220 [Corynebacterium freneyi DNF00450]KGF17152.1 hypothetical protein HMPREF1650_05515 [Corynebacterium freneyi DNF00450]
MNRAHHATRSGSPLDDDSLECLAASLLGDEAPPPSVHSAWRRDHSDGGDADSATVARPSFGTSLGSSFVSSFTAMPTAFAAAAAAVLLVAGGIWITAPGADHSPGGEAEDGPSSRTIAQPEETRPAAGGSEPAQPEIDLAALGPAVADAMGAVDLGGLVDPALAEACLAEHGERADALLGAAPMAHGDRVGQLFVLSTGMHGQVTVLLTVNTCGSEPEPPVVHETIGRPG